MSVPALPCGSIDTHAHVFERGLPLATQRRHSPIHDALPNSYLELLDAHGLAGGVLVQPSFLGTDNSYLLDALHLAKGRLRGVVVVAPGIEPNALAAMNKAGVTGMRLNLFGVENPDLDHPNWRNLLEQVQALNWHVEIHAQAARLPQLLPTLTTIVSRVVVDHFGRPDPALGIADPGFTWGLQQAGSARLWVKLAAPYRSWTGDACTSAAGQAAHRLLAAFGAQHLMWGSDWPHTEHQASASYAHALSWFDAWFDDQRIRQTLLTDTPAAFFHFQTPSLP